MIKIISSIAPLLMSDVDGTGTISIESKSLICIKNIKCNTLNVNHNISISYAQKIRAHPFLVDEAGKKCKISLDHGQILRRKCEFSHIHFGKKKTHLNVIFSLKIANISLQSTISPD